jgi:hypothetical protein
LCSRRRPLSAVCSLGNTWLPHQRLASQRRDLHRCYVGSEKYFSRTAPKNTSANEPLGSAKGRGASAAPKQHGGGPEMNFKHHLASIGAGVIAALLATGVATSALADPGSLAVLQKSTPSVSLVQPAHHGGHMHMGSGGPRIAHFAQPGRIATFRALGVSHGRRHHHRRIFIVSPFFYDYGYDYYDSNCYWVRRHHHRHWVCHSDY